MENLLEWFATALLSYWVISVLKDDPLNWLKFFFWCAWKIVLMVAVAGILFVVFVEAGWAWAISLLVPTQVVTFAIMARLASKK